CSRPCASCRHSASVWAARMGTQWTWISRDRAPRYSKDSALRPSPRSHSARASAPMRAGSVCGRTSSAPTRLGGAKPVGAVAWELLPIKRLIDTMASASSSAPSSHISQRVASATAPKPSRIHCSRRVNQEGFTCLAFGSSSPAFFQRRTLVLCVSFKSGSARKTATIALTWAREGACAELAGSALPRPRSAVSKSAGIVTRRPRLRYLVQGGVSARALGESAAKFLLDIPGLELDATIQIHRKTGCNKERLDQEHHAGIRERHHGCRKCRIVARQPADHIGR